MSRVMVFRITTIIREQLHPVSTPKGGGQYFASTVERLVQNFQTLRRLKIWYLLSIYRSHAPKTLNSVN